MAGGDTDFSDSEQNALTAINITTSAISMICSGFIVFSMLFLSYKAWKQQEAPLLKLTHSRLVFMLASADVCYSFAMIMGDPADGSSLCYFQSIWSSFFELTSVGWVVALAYYLYQSFVRQEAATAEEEEMLFYKIWAANWLFALFWTCIPFADGNHYGDSGAWCWIDGDDTGQAMRYMTFYLWLWVGIGTICYLYYQLFDAVYALVKEGKQLAKDKGDEKLAGEGEKPDEGCRCFAVIKMLWNGSEDAEMISITRRLCLYPVIMIGCWVFGTINRLHNSFDPQNPNFGLFVMHTLTSNLNGFFNAIVYGWNGPFREHGIRHCPCFELDPEAVGDGDVADDPKTAPTANPTAEPQGVVLNSGGPRSRAQV